MELHQITEDEIRKILRPHTGATSLRMEDFERQLGLLSHEKDKKRRLGQVLRTCISNYWIQEESGRHWTPQHQLRSPVNLER